MAVPILKEGDVLIASVQSTLTDAEWTRLRDELADRVGRQRCRGAVIDVTVLEVMDSFAARVLRATAAVLKLRGAETVLVGIQPEVAISMVQLGLDLRGIHTALDLEEGLELLRAQVGTRVPG